MDSRNKFCRLVFNQGLKVTLLSVGLLILSHCAPTITGRVLDMDGKKLYSSSARVNITPITTAATEKNQLLEMDADGTFATKQGLTKGATYMIEVLLPGYEIFSKEVTVQNNIVLDLKLKTLKKVETKTIQIDMEVEPNRGAGGATLTPPKF